MSFVSLGYIPDHTHGVNFVTEYADSLASFFYFSQLGCEIFHRCKSDICSLVGILAFAQYWLQVCFSK